MTGTEPPRGCVKDFGGPRGCGQRPGLAHMETNWFSLVDLGEVTWARTEVTRQGSRLEPGRGPEPGRP